MYIRVECLPNHLGEETPSRLILDGRALDVVDVIDRWIAVDHRYFKVRTADGAVYILRHDALSQRWEIIMFESAPIVRPLEETLH